MRISSIEYFQKSLDGLLTQQVRLNQIQQQVSTGKKFSQASEDPIGASNALQIRQDIIRFNQYSSNANTLRSNLEFEESVLQGLTNQYQRIRELAIAANSGALSNIERQAISHEIGVILNDLESIANTKNGSGEYIFSGFKTLTKAVVKDVSGQYVYQGDEGQRGIQLSDTSSIESNDTGKSIFFDIANNAITATQVAGITQVTSTNPGLVNVGALPTIDTNDLIINNIAIPAASTDGVSSIDAARSSLAIANAINSTITDHEVHAVVNENTYDMGVFNNQPIGANEFTINGVGIVNPVGTEASLINAINQQLTVTGVSATQPGGAGTAIVLTAQDGRNIQLQTNGGATADFANFTLTGGALDQVKRGTITLRSHLDVNIQGANPNNAGLTAGTTNLSANIGTGVMSAIQVVDTPSNINETYSIVFNAGGTSYDIVADSNPSIPIAGFDDVAYTSGQTINFDGLRFSISGAPQAGDVFNIQMTQPATQDIFTSVANAQQAILSYGAESSRLDYEIGVLLNNLEEAESVLNNTRAQIGARMNVTDSLAKNNDNITLIAQKTLSAIEDVDYAEAISLLSQTTFTLEVSQQAFARIQGLSLFNFI